MIICRQVERAKGSKACSSAKIEKLRSKKNIVYKKTNISTQDSTPSCSSQVQLNTARIIDDQRDYLAFASSLTRD